MEEVGERNVEVEEAVRLPLLLLGIGIGSWEVDGEVEVGEGVLVGRHRDGAGGRRRRRH